MQGFVCNVAQSTVGDRPPPAHPTNWLYSLTSLNNEVLLWNEAQTEVRHRLPRPAKLLLQIMVGYRAPTSVLFFWWRGYTPQITLRFIKWVISLLSHWETQFQTEYQTQIFNNVLKIRPTKFFFNLKIRILSNRKMSRDPNSITYDFVMHFWTHHFHLKSPNFNKMSYFEKAFKVPYNSKNAGPKFWNTHFIDPNSAQCCKIDHLWLLDTLLGIKFRFEESKFSK